MKDVEYNINSKTTEDSILYEKEEEENVYQGKEKGSKLLGERIEDELMKYILQKPVEVGEKIPNEFDLAEMFQVGRSTIREAVKGLVSRGILEIRRGSGTYVISTISVENDPLGLGELEDKYKMSLELFEIRLIIEPEIAALASQKATKEERRKLMELCDETEQLYRQGLNHIQKDIEFHNYIAACSKNRVVERLMPVIHSSVVAFASVTKRMLKHETIETHREVAESIAKGDAVGARCAMIMHLTYNRQMILKMIEERDGKSKGK